MDKENGLEKVAALLADVKGAAWTDLPDLGLYMDQVTGYLNKYLGTLSLSREEAPLTPSMINNYVKNGHIARPTQKKYSREQLASLYMLCSLKNNLSLPDAAALIYFLTEEHGMDKAYTHFVGEQKENAEALAAQFADLSDGDTLADLALELALRACAERLAAEALIEYLIKKDDEKMAQNRKIAEAERAKREAQEKAERAAKASAKKKGEKKQKKERKDKKAE